MCQERAQRLSTASDPNRPAESVAPLPETPEQKEEPCTTGPLQPGLPKAERRS